MKETIIKVEEIGLHFNTENPFLYLLKSLLNLP